ncbi:MFS general substrate transporter [Colletotrichum falcatum]|nr:MFS general substrate transporter [Colletotrichum falcatum]
MSTKDTPNPAETVIYPTRTDVEMVAPIPIAPKSNDAESFLVAFAEPRDAKNPKQWPDRQKWAVTNVLSATGFNRIMVLTIMAPALTLIAAELNMNPTETLMSLSIYLLATAFGPLLIGPLSEMYGRRVVLHTSNLWFLIWNIALMVVFCLTTFRETHAPTILKRRASKLRRETGGLYQTPDERNDRHRSVLVVSSLVSAFNYGILYIVLTSFAELYNGHYHQSVEISGLHYIACAAGEIVGSQLGGPLIDILYRRMVARSADGEHQPEFRLRLVIPGAVLGPLSLFMYGWTAEYLVHWAYIMDAYPDHISSALSASQFPRSLTAFLFPLFAPSLYSVLGYGWGNTAIDFAGLFLGILSPALLWSLGPRLRKRLHWVNR